MFWIVGAGTLVKALEKLGGNDFTRFLSRQLQHVQWQGVRFYDLIFPLFLFLIGVSMVFSLDRTIRERGSVGALWPVLRRSVLLFLFGVFYSGGLSHRWPEVALGGVLQRIAACYFLAALIYCWCGRGDRGIPAIASALLLGYWALLTFVPFPDLRLDRPSVEQVEKQIGTHAPAAVAAAVPTRVHGVYEEGRNLTNYVDYRFLPGKKAQTYYINEGLLSTFPALAICLFGILAGRLLKDSTIEETRKVMWLLGCGALGVLAGWLWSFQFPLVKRIWTSSFILVASGYSAMLLGLFYQVVEIWKRDRWCEPFVWIGMNPITLYLAYNVLSFTQLAERLVGGDIKALFDALAPGLGSLVIALCALALVFLLAWFLHRRRIFLRV